MLHSKAVHVHDVPSDCSAHSLVFPSFSPLCQSLQREMTFPHNLSFPLSLSGNTAPLTVVGLCVAACVLTVPHV